jgi:hypothetical protein
VIDCDHPVVADLILRTVFPQLAVAVDRVAVQIERDVIGADHDSIVWAVDQIAVERRVSDDRVATAHVRRERRTGADS